MPVDELEATALETETVAVEAELEATVDVEEADTEAVDEADTEAVDD